MPYRHAEEVLHHRMVDGVVAKPGVTSDVGEAYGTAVQQLAQDSVDPGQITDQRRLLLRNAHCQKACEPAPAIGHAQGSVARTDGLSSHVQDALQDAVEIYVLGDHQK